MVNAFLSWLDLTASDRDKARRVLDLFNEQGTVDELGLGSLRDLLSNALFPGTSVLHTRLRYALFIPWIYREIESWGGGYDVASEARQLEVDLIDALAASEDTEGIIGNHARQALLRLASSAYWAVSSDDTHLVLGASASKSRSSSLATPSGRCPDGFLPQRRFCGIL